MHQGRPCPSAPTAALAELEVLFWFDDDLVREATRTPRRPACDQHAARSKQARAAAWACPASGWSQNPRWEPWSIQ